MANLPNPVHVTILGLGLTVIVAALTLGRQIGDWRSKTAARLLGALASLLGTCWLYFALLWLFKIDLWQVFAERPGWSWGVTGILSLLAIGGWGASRISKRGASAASAPATAQKLAGVHPKVMLSRRGTGIDLRVESLNMEAVNVRLVPAQSNHYRLRSENVRCLRVGVSESIELHCERRQKNVAHWDSSPADFFNDFYPTYEGEDTIGALEHAYTSLMEKQLLVPLELAYSGIHIDGVQHYRGGFLIRWCALTESIVDVEPKGIRLDLDPPSSAPLNVITD